MAKGKDLEKRVRERMNQIAKTFATQTLGDTESQKELWNTLVSDVERTWGGARSGPAEWAKWWRALESEGKSDAVNDSISRAWIELTGLSPDEITSDWHKDMIITLHGAGSVSDPEEAYNILKKWIPKVWKPQVNQFNQAIKTFTTSAKAALEQMGYDTEYWDEGNKLEDEFVKALIQRGGPEAASDATAYVVQLVENDTIKKRKLGAIDEEGIRNTDAFEFDPETGAATEIKGAKAKYDVSKYTNMLQDRGWDTNSQRAKDFAEHLSKIQKEDKLTDYEVQQLIDADKETIQIEYNKAREQLLPQLDQLQQQEIATIEAEGERLRGVTQQVFREDIAPEIRREALMLGGRGREFGAASLAEAAAELEQRRQETISGMKLSAEMADIERRRSLAGGQVEEARTLAQYGAEQGLTAQAQSAQAKLADLSAIRQLSMSKSIDLSNRAQERYQREYEKVQARLFREQQDRQKAAEKKAGRLGMYSNVFSGMASGAATGSAGGPWGAVAGGVIGGVLGYVGGRAQQQQAAGSESIGGFSPSMYSAGGQVGGYVGSGISSYLQNYRANQIPRGATATPSTSWYNSYMDYLQNR